MKKHQSLTLLIFSLFAFMSCNVQWFADMKTDMDEKFSTEFRFYSFKEEDVEDAFYETCLKKIGEEFVLADYPVENINSQKTGYHVQAWNFYRTSDGSSSIEDDSLITYKNSHVEKLKVSPQGFDFYADWAPNTDTKYTVRHFVQNVELTDYVLRNDLTEELTGTTDKLTSAAAKNIPGFTPQEIIQKNINGDGSTIVDVYYNRNRVSVKIFYNDGRASDGETFEGYFGQTVTGITIPDRSAEAKIFEKWNVLYEDGSTDTVKTEQFTYPAKNASYTLIWKVVPAKVTITVIYPPAENDIYMTCTINVGNNPNPGAAYLITCTDFPDWYSSYKWVLDGDVVNSVDSLILNMEADLDVGLHSLLLLVTDATGNQYSKEFFIRVEE